MATTLKRFVLFLAAISFLPSCGAEPEPERNFKDDLELALGRELTPNEVVAFKDTADLLCSTNDNILIKFWNALNEEELTFQTLVFPTECPERADFYREHHPVFDATPTSTTTPTTNLPTS